MALVNTFDDAKVNQLRRPTAQGGLSIKTQFFSPRTNPGYPQAKLSEHFPGRITRAHFHFVDQFQIIVDGRCRFGRHDVHTYGVHFSRAYTPYGPLLADAETGFLFFVLRTRHDPGSQSLAQGVQTLKQMADRRPWQVTRHAVFPTGDTRDTVLQAIPEITDQHGLAAYTLRVKANASMTAPDPSHGDGQYVVALKGSLWHENKERSAPALVFVYPHESAYCVRAGAQGLDALILNFPRVEQRVTNSAAAAPFRSGEFKRWQCALCSFIYDEALGMPDEGIAAGTRWEDVPDSWTCPDCSTSKTEFKMMEMQ